MKLNEWDRELSDEAVRLLIDQYEAQIDDTRRRLLELRNELKRRANLASASRATK